MPPSPDDVQGFVVAQLRKRNPSVRPEALAGQTNLITTGIIDSFGLLELVSEIEKRFGVQIDLGQHEFEVVSTLGGLCAAVVAG